MKFCESPEVRFVLIHSVVTMGLINELQDFLSFQHGGNNVICKEIYELLLTLLITKNNSYLVSLKFFQ